MPLACDGGAVRYRRHGDTRLAFCRDRVVEAKNMKTGAMHTQAEFAADRKRPERKRGRR